MMNVNQVEAFIKSNRKYNLSLLLNSHARLSIIQIKHGVITFDDILQCIYLSGHNINSFDSNAHAALICESCLIPILTTKGQIKLQMNKDVIANDDNFLKFILLTLTSKSEGLSLPAVDEFRMEVLLYFKSSGKTNQNIPSTIISEPRYVNDQLDTCTKFSNFQATNLSLQSGNNNRSNDNNFNKFDIEKSEPIVRLLAQVRKVGMDILFPQSTHDKILACIYVTILNIPTPAHRELIDMIMKIKEANIISQLENVSKTKIRGILALLKHGEMLITQGIEGEPVRLYMPPDIKSFGDLRNKHDIFLEQYMNEHHLFIPTLLKSELVWQFDQAIKDERLEALQEIISHVKAFFKGESVKISGTLDALPGDSNGFSQKIAEEQKSTQNFPSFPSSNDALQNYGSSLLTDSPKSILSENYVQKNRSPSFSPKNDSLNVPFSSYTSTNLEENSNNLISFKNVGSSQNINYSHFQSKNNMTNISLNSQFNLYQQKSLDINLIKDLEGDSGKFSRGTNIQNSNLYTRPSFSSDRLKNNDFIRYENKTTINPHINNDISDDFLRNYSKDYPNKTVGSDFLKNFNKREESFSASARLQKQLEFHQRALYGHNSNLEKESPKDAPAISFLPMSNSTENNLFSIEKNYQSNAKNDILGIDGVSLDFLDKNNISTNARGLSNSFNQETIHFEPDDSNFLLKHIDEMKL